MNGLFMALVKDIISVLLFGRNNGTNILEEEWDNLIILDACRYDIFERLIKEEKSIPGRLEYRISHGSDTTEFLLKNFNDDQRSSNIVYITANPFVSMILKGKVYKIIPVWDFGWDSYLNTVPPQNVYFYALKAIQKYPDKRLIVHFIQPHYPYINFKFTSAEEPLRQLRDEAKFDNSMIQRDFSPPLRLKSLLRIIAERKMYPVRFYVDIPLDLHLRAYIDNLKLVLPYVKNLVNVLPGRTVVTADHGEAFGEKIHPLIPIRVYGHLPRIRIQELVKVPWLIVEEKLKPPEKVRKRILKKELTRCEVNRISQNISSLKRGGRI